MNGKGRAPRGPLDGIRVLEWSEGIGGPTAAWLLGELGADVLKIERPEGDRFRAHLGFAVLNRGKRGVVLDLADGADRDRFLRLAAAADAVLVDESDVALERAGVGYDAKRLPAVVWCAVPTFGRGGPRAELPPDEGLAQAASGVSTTQWSYGRTPVHLVTPMVGYASGFVAALGVVAALRGRALTGRGQRVDTSGLAGAMCLQSGTYVSGPAHQGSLAAQADDPRGVFPTYGLYATADGWMFVGALTQPFWASLATALGRTDLLADPSFPQSPLEFGRSDVRARLRAELEPLFRARRTDEWLALLAEVDVPAARVQSRREFLDEPLARQIGAAIEIDDPERGTLRCAGAPIVFDGARPAPPVHAPPLDRESDPSFRPRSAPFPPPRGPAAAPLDGVRVLDLTSFIAGPVCPMHLADLGADVVKIEAPLGDPFRFAAYGFEGWNRGKRSLVLDLKSRSGCEAFLRLAARADVVVENFRGGVMERLGLGFPRLSAANPRLVYVQITGFGPDSALPAFDPVLQARSGLCRAQGGEGEPVLHQIAVTDYMTGTLAAFGTVAALVERERTGRGRHVDVSLFRTAFAMQAAEIVECAGTMPQPRGGRDLLGRSAAYRAYAAVDGWVFVAAAQARAAAALAAHVGLDVDVLAAPIDGAAARRIAASFAERRRDEVVAGLARAGVPAAPCLRFAEVFGDRQLRAEGLVVDVAHPRLGAVVETGRLFRFSATRLGPLRPAPALGEHGAEVLREAGFAPEEIAALSPTEGTSAAGRPR